MQERHQHSVSCENDDDDDVLRWINGRVKERNGIHCSAKHTLMNINVLFASFAFEVKDSLSVAF